MSKFLRRFHLFMMGVWACLAVPGILWWKESILFVIILSIYANIAGEFAAYQGSRSEEKLEQIDHWVESCGCADVGESDRPVKPVPLAE